MIQSTISLQDYELSEDGLYKIEVPVEGLTGQYTIICDGKQDLNNFDMDYYGDDGIIVTRNRCELTVQITPNKTQFVREYTIICRHTNDYYVYAELALSEGIIDGIGKIWLGNDVFDSLATFNGKNGQQGAPLSLNPVSI